MTCLKARLVGRGDLMKAWVAFYPDAIYCGNVSSCSIKICVTIAAKYELEVRGGDLVGAYLITKANEDYRVYLKCPEGYTIPDGMCMEAVGNLYGFLPAGHNFFVELDKCVKECGFKKTPWDLKFFYKWKNNRPELLIAHSDDSRVCCDKCTRMAYLYPILTIGTTLLLSVCPVCRMSGMHVATPDSMSTRVALYASSIQLATPRRSSQVSTVA